MVYFAQNIQVNDTSDILASAAGIHQGCISCLQFNIYSEHKMITVVEEWNGRLFTVGGKKEHNLH